jgi:hypothetical protein
MTNSGTLQNVYTIMETIEKSVNIHLILLIAILALLVIVIGHFVISKLLCRIKGKGKGGDKNNSAGVEPTKQLLKLIPNLQKEITELHGFKEKAKNYDNLKKNYENVKKDNETLSQQKSKLETEKSDLQEKLNAKETEVAEKLKEIEEQNKANGELLSKVKNADNLKDYAGKVVNYLGYFESILKNVSDTVATPTQTDTEIAKIMSVLFRQALQKTTEMSKWKQICKDIQENCIAIQNKELKNCFQSDKAEETLKAFKKMCISNLKSFTNAILILCKAYSNLSKFLENTDVSSIECEFKQRIEAIKSKAKEIGITEIADTELFINLDKNKNTESEDEQVSYPYSAVKNLKKDDIVEIIQFGMKTEFENMTKTRLLIN